MRSRIAMIDNIRLRISADEKRALARAAERHGLTLSQFIREQAISAAARVAA
jgi:uncharacterized protein (DUF1778 family)